MSVVIAIKHKNKIYIGCDTQVSTTLGDKSSLAGECQKVWHYEDLPDLVMGGVGSLRDLQIIQTSHDIFQPLEILLNKINYSYLVQNFFTNVYNTLKRFDRVAEKGIEELPSVADSWIVAFKDKMYKIDGEGSVLESDDYLVIGSGEAIATGVLESNKGKKPQDRITQAIKACADKTLYVNNSIYITSTDLEGDNDLQKQK